MSKNVYMILFITATLFLTHQCDARNSFQEKIRTFLQRYSAEKVDQKEFPATSITSLSLAHINGSVTIKTGPKKSLFLRTIKRARKESLLDTLEVVTEIHNNHLAITTKNNAKRKTGCIEYELIVPASLDIAINITGYGNVCIKDVHGTLDIVTQDNIDIMNTKKLASMQTLKKGSISIINAHGPIEAYTQQGNITAENIAHNCDARSTSGKIMLTYKTVPATGSINLTTTSGNILLGLPAETNAEICGNTTYGTFMSDHDITLKSYTTKLNKTTWKQFTQHVDGTIGTGDATIKINSAKGNVKIVENVVT